MGSIIRDELVRTDTERTWRVDQILTSLGFERHKVHRSSRTRVRFTDRIMYRDLDTNETLFVSFPNEKEADQGTRITVRVQHRGQFVEWRSLNDFENALGRNIGHRLLP